MSNTIDSPNFLTFPVVFDPFDSYKNIGKDLEKSILTSKAEDETNNVKTKAVKSNDLQLFITMVSHQVKFESEGNEFVTNEVVEEADGNGISNNDSRHPLGKYCPFIPIYTEESQLNTEN